MTGLLASQDPLDPGNNFVGAGVARFVQINDTTADIALELALQRGTSIGDWGEVACSHEKVVVVLE